MKLDAAVVLVFMLLIVVPVSALAWEPTKPIEFVVPAGTGGGADQMARLIAGIAEKHKLSPRPLIVVNKSGGAGAEGFLDVKSKRVTPTPSSSRSRTSSPRRCTTTSRSTGVTTRRSPAWRSMSSSCG